MVRDVVQETMAVDYEAIRMSPEVLGALEELRTYMFQHLYLIPQIRSEFEKAQRILIALFEYVTAHPEQFFSDGQTEDVDRLAIDFIAGMTDRYAMTLYSQLFLPKPWG